MTTTDGKVSRIAHAKVNLTLHVTGQRDDGYHLLDSLVMFTSLGDKITVCASNDLNLTIDGPFADGLSCDENLVLRAARLLSPDRGAAIHLTKNLPVASGIGGGSADAAATLFALSELWQMPLPSQDDVLTLGADLPLCMSAELARMRGIGEDIQRMGPAPMLDILLVNPMVQVSTPAMFGALAQKQNAPMTGKMPDPFDTDAWLNWIEQQRNDLQEPAIASVPVIAKVLAALVAQSGCVLTRMSGSGATCFAIFDDFESCEAAKTALQTTHPTWWVAQTDEAPS